MSTRGVELDQDFLLQHSTANVQGHPHSSDEEEEEEGEEEEEEEEEEAEEEDREEVLHNTSDVIDGPDALDEQGLPRDSKERQTLADKAESNHQEFPHDRSDQSEVDRGLNETRLSDVS